MKKFVKDIIIKPIIRLFARTISWLFPIKKGLVVCWSFNGLQYGGNPKYISEYLSEHSSLFSIVWLKSRDSRALFPLNVKTVLFNTLAQVYYMNVAEFLMTDNRTDSQSSFWYKRKKQKYIMTWHGGMGIKKIEGDAVDSLPKQYIELAKKDSKMADLFISGSTFLTHQYRSAFWYDGEIIQKGMPVYDAYFDTMKVERYRLDILKLFNIQEDTFILLYAPTFRKDHSIEHYKIDWGKVSDEICHKYGKKVIVFLKLHPGLISKNIDISSLKTSENVIDVTSYGDIIPLICASDMLITDYSATMFEMALLKKPTLIYASDWKEYDRGFYFPIQSLPFLFADNMHSLLDNIRQYNKEEYTNKISLFMTDVLGVCDNGEANINIMKWFLKKTLQK